MTALENEVSANQDAIAARALTGLTPRQMAQAITLLADQIGMSPREYRALVTRLEELTSEGPVE